MGLQFNYDLGWHKDALQECQGSVLMQCHAQASLQHSACAEGSAAVNSGTCQPGRCLSRGCPEDVFTARNSITDTCHVLYRMAMSTANIGAAWHRTSLPFWTH